jgi:hypothetical protein
MVGLLSPTLSSKGGEGKGEGAVLFGSWAEGPLRQRHSRSWPASLLRLACHRWLSVGLLSQLLDWERNEAVVLHLSDHLDATRAPLQCVPDLPENTFLIAAPLMVPEAQLLNVLGCQELRPRGVMSLLPGQPVFKAVQFNWSAVRQDNRSQDSIRPAGAGVGT